jgi:hypothetical protein
MIPRLDLPQDQPLGKIPADDSVRQEPPGFPLALRDVLRADEELPGNRTSISGLRIV